MNSDELLERHLNLSSRGNQIIFRYPGLTFGVEDPDTDLRAESVLLGFWLFLMSDAILFGMAFATYLTLLPGMAAAPGPAQLYQPGPVFAETLILLASSFTFGLSSWALKYRHVRSLAGGLLVTLALGLAFLALELHDFKVMFAAGGLPTRSGFLSGFFGLVPLHGLHVAAGCLWLICLLGQIARHGADAKTRLGMLRLALFWHFLDIVWIAVFSVVYLMGLA